MGSVVVSIDDAFALSLVVAAMFFCNQHIYNAYHKEQYFDNIHNISLSMMIDDIYISVD
jgi:hypothetical protein